MVQFQSLNGAIGSMPRSSVILRTYTFVEQFYSSVKVPSIVVRCRQLSLSKFRNQHGFGFMVGRAHCKRVPMKKRFTVQLFTILLAVSSSALGVPLAAVAPDSFPDSSSCPRFQKELQFLKSDFDQGVAQGRAWRNVADQHTERGDRWQAVAGSYVSQPWVQATGIVSGAALVVVGAATVVSTPILVVGIIAAGGAAYLLWPRATDYRQQLEVLRKREIKHIDYFDLVKASQDYERNFIWPEQVARFKRLIQLNAAQMGLPTYKGGYQAFPVQNLGDVLRQQFSYFNVQVQLFYQAYHRLEDLPQETNWYVSMTTQRHADIVKARMARSLSETYAYQAQLAYATGLALGQACANGTLTPSVPKP